MPTSALPSSFPQTIAAQIPTFTAATALLQTTIDFYGIVWCANRPARPSSRRSHRV